MAKLRLTSPENRTFLMVVPAIVPATVPAAAIPVRAEVGLRLARRADGVGRWVVMARAGAPGPASRRPGHRSIILLLGAILSFGLFVMDDPELLNVAEVAKTFRVTMQTIRNWIDWGKLPASRVGRGFLVRRVDVERLLAAAEAQDGALATARNVWDPTVTRLVLRDHPAPPSSVWDEAAVVAALAPRRK